MIGSMRRHSKTLLLIVMVPIIVAFVFWGGGRGRAKRKNPVVGEIFDKKVTLSELRRAARIISRLRLARNTEELEMLAWRHLLLMKESEHWGMKISKGEFSRRIKEEFSSENGFDPQEYQDFLARQRVNPADFENEIKEAFLVEKLQRRVAGTARITPRELRERYDIENSGVKIQYYLVRDEKFLSVLSGLGRAKEYFLEHLDEFIKPRRVMVQYVVIEPEKFLTKAGGFTDDELGAWYEKHRDRFRDETGSAPVLSAIKQQVREALKRERAGELARKKAEQLFGNAAPAKMREIALSSRLELRISEIAGGFGYVDDYLETSSVFVQEALKAPVGKLSRVFDTEKGPAVLAPMEIIEKGPENFSEAADRIKRQSAQAEEQERIESIQQHFDLKGYIESGVDALSVTKDSYPEVSRYYRLNRGENPRFNEIGKRRVQYILLDLNEDRFRLKETITEKDMETYYQAHKDKFIDEDFIFKPFEEVKDEIEKELRHKYTITEEEIRQYYDDHIFAYRDFNDSEIPLANVRDEIIEQFEEEKKLNLVKEMAEEIFRISLSKSMRSLADRYNLSIRYTELFGFDEKVDDYVGDSAEFKVAAFKTAFGDVSDIIQTERGFAILSPIEEYPLEPTIAPLAKIYEVVQEEMSREEAADMAYDVMERLKDDIDRKMSSSDTSFDSACGDLGIRLAESEWFSRVDRDIPEIGYVGYLAYQSTSEKTTGPFEMKIGEASPTLRLDGGAMFYSLAATRLPADEEFEEEKDEYLELMLQRRQQEVLAEWYLKLGEKGGIKRFTSRSGRK